MDHGRFKNPKVTVDRNRGSVGFYDEMKVIIEPPPKKDAPPVNPVRRPNRAEAAIIAAQYGGLSRQYRGPR